MAPATFTLSNGAKVDRLGFGTWQSEPEKVSKALEHAIKTGYRHLDLAKVYGNQKECGDGIRAGIKAAGIKREDLFITSKLWNSQHRPEDVPAALDDCLSELGLDYLDLYLVHFPVAFASEKHLDLFPMVEGASPEEVKISDDVSIVDTWRAMTKLDKKKARAVGVSNHTVEHLEKIIKEVGEKPAANQVERHPLLPDFELLEYCEKNGILVTAYSPLGNNTVGEPLLTENSEVKRIAKETGRTPAQVLLGWAQALPNVSVIPKSVTPSRIEENLKSEPLEAEHVKALDALGKSNPRRYNVPYVANKPRWPINIWNTEGERECKHTVVL